MNPYPLEIFWSEEDRGFIAEVPDLPGCNAFGVTEAEAAAEAQGAITAWLDAAKAASCAIPEFTTVERVGRYSEEFLVRVPRSLRAWLARQAKHVRPQTRMHA